MQIRIGDGVVKVRDGGGDIFGSLLVADGGFGDLDGGLTTLVF